MSKIVLGDINIKDLIKVLKRIGEKYDYCVMIMDNDEENPTFELAGQVGDPPDEEKPPNPFEELGGEPFGLN